MISRSQRKHRIIRDSPEVRVSPKELQVSIFRTYAVPIAVGIPTYGLTIKQSNSTSMKSIAIFCGANFNGDLALKEAAELLTEIMAERDISLVFGGGKVGMMGLLADNMLTRGGKAIGVIPQFLMDKEV